MAAAHHTYGPFVPPKRVSDKEWPELEVLKLDEAVNWSARFNELIDQHYHRRIGFYYEERHKLWKANHGILLDSGDCIWGEPVSKLTKKCLAFAKVAKDVGGPATLVSTSDGKDVLHRDFVGGLLMDAHLAGEHCDASSCLALIGEAGAYSEKGFSLFGLNRCMVNLILAECEHCKSKPDDLNLILPSAVVRVKEAEKRASDLGVEGVPLRKSKRLKKTQDVASVAHYQNPSNLRTALMDICATIATEPAPVFPIAGLEYLVRNHVSQWMGAQPDTVIDVVCAKEHGCEVGNLLRILLDVPDELYLRGTRRDTEVCFRLLKQFVRKQFGNERAADLVREKAAMDARLGAVLAIVGSDDAYGRLKEIATSAGLVGILDKPVQSMMVFMLVSTEHLSDILDNLDNSLLQELSREAGFESAVVYESECAEDVWENDVLAPTNLVFTKAILDLIQKRPKVAAAPPPSPQTTPPQTAGASIGIPETPTPATEKR